MGKETVRKEINLHENWFIKQCDSIMMNDEITPGLLQDELSCKDGWLTAEMPNTVQEVLFSKGLLDSSVLETGVADKTNWVSERDWIFHTTFKVEDPSSLCFLEFDRLDTVADIFLNGEKIGRHESMFKPSKIEVSGKLEQDNSLIIYFHSPAKVIESLKKKIPDRYEGRVGPQALLRKPHGDFNSHAGVIPYFTPIGVYGPIRLVLANQSEIEHVDIDVRLNEDLTRADLRITLLCPNREGIIPELELYAPNGSQLLNTTGCVKDWVFDQETMQYSFLASVENPELWWPKGYGEQPMYTLKTSIGNGSVLYHCVERKIGVRKVEMLGNLKFRINGQIVRLWGSCITPMWGVSHRWQRERGLKILDYVDKAHMNVLRLWGPSQPYDDEFYDEADRLGILIWQEFHTAGTHMPDLQSFTELVVAESEFMIRRLKHHPCIFMWCGGNEQIYMADLFDKEAKDRIGHDLIRYTLRDIVVRMDPTRYYHISSPSGGKYANEACYNDNHGSRASLSYLPGEGHARFFSEDIRTSIPEFKSLKRFIKPEELWPEDFMDITSYGVTKPLPPAWMKRTINHMEEKAGPYELFYDATDPESLIFKMNEAAVYDNRNIIHRLRQGKPFYNSMADRECNGYLAWKMNTAWPQIYCALIDYYLEPCRTYYGIRRAYSPVHVSVDLQDHVYIWGVNDTPAHFDGELTVRIYDLERETETHTFRCPVGIPSGDSLILKNLDSLGQFWRTSVIYTCLEQVDGKMVCEDFQYIKPERKLRFPEASLSMRKVGDRLIEITTDKFARCVELTGDNDGDKFGWHFEDNYFDMIPGQTRRIRLFGNHSKGTVCAKAFYSPYKTSITL